jgi:hypothetical protein
MLINALPQAPVLAPIKRVEDAPHATCSIDANQSAA